MRNILVTGGAGFIGSHTVLCLLQSGFRVTVVDNLCNSTFESLNRVESICGLSIERHHIDITDECSLSKIFACGSFDAVIHFAGLKAVGESVSRPFEYYHANVHGTFCLVRQMLRHSVHRLVFSSSATVYGLEAPVPYVETLQRGTALNPYGASKAMVERVLEDICIAEPKMSVTLLRYFNPIGAHSSGLIGENPLGIPNTLMPFMAQVAVGKLNGLSVFGDDYGTLDGTCRRDYLHVMDLAEGHVKALEEIDVPSCRVFNLGTGTPLSVLEMIATFESVTGMSIPYEIVSRRNGDLAEFWADPAKANNELGWVATRSVEEMVADTWRWQKNNPNGYG